ncbi:UpxY family transcription antiterminator [Aquimarina sp. 2304DJ70-9]|uniref:UpxY family transcription antiterminator n=1 Tax=Aquimarina penaris TaxID=3231044 RepID=UPI0034631344
MGKLLKIGWYVLYVRSRQEKKVDNLLKESHLESFLPLVKTVRQWSDRKKIIEAPLFPSYVFVKINSAQDFYKASSIEGACTFVRCGGEYALAQDDEIQKIKLFLGSKDVTNVSKSNDTLEVGEVMMIQYGSLAGLECEVLKVNNESKIVVRLNSINQSITATIPSQFLSKISKAV